MVILNSHGGQPQIVDLACRRLRANEMFVVSCLASPPGLPQTVKLTQDEQRHGIHGGLIETSLMLHLHPGLVRMDQAIDFRSAWLAREAEMSLLTPEGGNGLGWETQDLHPAGA